MELEIRDSALQLIGGSPEIFQVTNGDATNTASALGLAGEGSPARLFGMLEDLQAALASGDADDPRFGQRADGHRGRGLPPDDEERRPPEGSGLGRRDPAAAGRAPALQPVPGIDVDVAQVAADLSRAETTYQASLLVTSKLYQTNLMQFLR